jgi:DNA-binding MurR/RpiR family transcriptional regulator
MSAPHAYDDLRNLIARRHPDLSDRLRRIAEFAVQNPNDMALKTVAALADRIGVQPSSIIRFANSFGYDGFSEMQQVFRSRLVADATPSYRERIASMHGSTRGKGRANGDAANAPTAVLSQFVADDIGALEELHNRTAERDLVKAVTLLAQAKSIHLLGQGRSFPVAFYLHYALSRLDLRAFLVDSLAGTTVRQARMAARDDAIIAISFKDYSPDVVSAVEEATVRKVPVIAITDSPLSPLAPSASICFEIAERRDRPFRSLVAPMCLAESLVVSLGHRLAERNS